MGKISEAFFECEEFETTNATLCEYCGHRPVQHVAVNDATGNIKEPPQKKAKIKVRQHAMNLNQDETSEEEVHA